MQRFKLERRPFPAELQGQIPGFTFQCGEQCIVIIDSTAPEETQEKTLRHELAHLVLNHLEQTKPIKEINSFGDDMFGDGWIDREREADRYAEQMTAAELAELMQWAI